MSKTLELHFDSQDSLDTFVDYWLDGGGDPGCIDWDTSWETNDDGSIKNPVKYLKIAGTGDLIE